MHPAFQRIDHRPWPVPDRPWRWRQVWHELAFLHWPVSSSTIRHLVPRELEIDEFDGSAWVAVTPFWMSGVMVRHLPALPGIGRFAELNVRTYVRQGDRLGVWFLSLDAGSRLAVRVARWRFRLPYFYARMTHRRGNDTIHYHSSRPGGPSFGASYEPTGPVFTSRQDTLEYFLTERYCLYSQNRSRRLYQAEIHHVPWPLQRAQVQVDRNEMLASHGMVIAHPPPHVMYAERLEVVVWPLEPAPVGASGFG
ncbi:MAG: YqjF family protein [Gemmatimonadales bacterium]